MIGMKRYYWIPERQLYCGGRGEFLSLLVYWAALPEATQDADPNQGLHIWPDSSEKNLWGEALAIF